MKRSAKRKRKRESHLAGNAIDFQVAEEATRRAAEAGEAAKEDQLVFGPPMVDYYYDGNGKKTRKRQCRVVGCEKLGQKKDRNCCITHSKVYKRRFVDGAETDPYEAIL